MADGHVLGEGIKTELNDNGRSPINDKNCKMDENTEIEVIHEAHVNNGLIESRNSNVVVKVEINDKGGESDGINFKNFLVASDPQPYTFKWTMLLVWDLLVACFWTLPIYLYALIRLLIPKRPKDLSNEIALVTFGGSGLGKEIVLELVKRGARVAVCDPILADAQETVSEARSFKNVWCTAFAYQMDAIDWETIKRVKDEIARDFETHVTILVDHRNEIVCKSFVDGSEQEYNEVIKYNLMSRIMIIKTFLPEMITTNHGHIVTVLSSLGGQRGVGNGLVYSASDFAVRGMIEGLRDELDAKETNGIKVTLAHAYYVTSLKTTNGKVDLRFPPMQAEKAAKLLVNGIARGYDVFTVPSYMYYMITVASSLPRKLQKIYNEIFYVNLFPKAKRSRSEFKRKRTLSIPRIKTHKLTWQRY